MWIFDLTCALVNVACSVLVMWSIYDDKIVKRECLTCSKKNE